MSKDEELDLFISLSEAEQKAYIRALKNSFKQEQKELQKENQKRKRKHGKSKNNTISSR